MKGLFRDFLVHGSHSILFQAPAVVSGKFYIPPALVALFHNVNVLVKAFTLLFTEIFTFVGYLMQKSSL